MNAHTQIMLLCFQKEYWRQQQRAQYYQAKMKAKDKQHVDSNTTGVCIRIKRERESEWETIQSNKYLNKNVCTYVRKVTKKRGKAFYSTGLLKGKKLSENNGFIKK